jgi:Ca-activated chloride channel family protein
MIEMFHFLRPLWLVALPIIGVVWWVIRRRDATQVGITAKIAPHLKEALTIGRDARSGIRAIDGVALLLVMLALVASGPTWSKRVSPWFEETAPLVIAVQVSDSMRANDLQPTRLDRARFKILDLIEARTGSRTALIAYAGSAHIVVPPSKDAGVLKPFLASLDPAIMPVPGADAASVLPLAMTLLGDQAAGGTLLFVNDGFDVTAIEPLAEFSSVPNAPSVVALVVGTDEGGVAFLPDGSPVMAQSGKRIDTAVDRSTLRRVASEGNVAVVRATTGDADIRQLLRAIDSNLRLADDPDAEWRDAGWWLLWLVLFLALPWFRRGWTMQW